MTDIPGYETFTKIEPIDKGLSSDKKYYIETIDGQRLLLRVTDVKEFDRKKAEYGMMERVYALGVLTPRPFGFGLCDGGRSVYSLSGWIDGVDAESALPRMSEAEQYSFGYKAGKLFRNIHALPAPEGAEPWGARFRRKVQRRMELYSEHRLESQNGGRILRYLHDKQDFLDSRPQMYWHGDMNIGNHIITPEGGIAAIDFNYWNLDYGDPWWEFVMIPWGKEPPAHYFTGMINGYFDNDPPTAFFEALSYYYACDALSALCYTFLDEPCAPEDGRRHMENVLRWFDDMRNPVPTWYLKDLYVQWADGVPYKLKAPFDFSFLSKYGKVFKVFDGQDSGNICFGVADGGKRYFVKFAGAPTARACVSAEEAAANLKRAVPTYRDLAHPNLINLINAEEIGGGFVMVFDWVDGACQHPMYPLSRKKFLRASMETRIKIFEDILAFHAHAMSKGYVAIDFYDGSILYDFGNARTMICDIDFYAKKPYINQMGRLWGSSRFMSPEEFTLGAEIDEITNVYGMGATAFALFSGGGRALEKWPLHEKQYGVVKRAVSDDRDHRQQSIPQLIAQWRAAAAAQ